MSKLKVSIDGVDIIICVSLWGGFVTGNWLPMFFFTAIAIIGAIYSKN